MESSYTRSDLYVLSLTCGNSEGLLELRHVLVSVFALLAEGLDDDGFDRGRNVRVGGHRAGHGQRLGEVPT